MLRNPLQLRIKLKFRHHSSNGKKIPTYCSQLLDHMNLRIVLQQTECLVMIYLEKQFFYFEVHCSCHLFVINSIALFAIVLNCIHKNI